MVFSVSAVFRTPVSEHTHELQVMLLEKRNNPVVEHVGSDKCILPIIQFGKSFGVSIEDRLLINMPPFDVSCIIISSWTTRKQE